MQGVHFVLANGTASKQTQSGFGNVISFLSRLCACSILLFAAGNANAQATDCSDLPNATLDGFVTPNPPSNINIDTDCTVRNYPASNPLDTNFSFFTQTGQTDDRHLIIFDNVVHVGQMSCNSVLDHKIWFTNGSSSTIQDNCQNLLIPVEKIDKQNPPGDAATVGVPFKYSLIIPVLFDPATGTIVPVDGSVNDLHSIVVTDDLNATGVDLTYVGHTITWQDSGASVDHVFDNNNGFLTFTLDPAVVIPASEQIVIELEVVLENTPTNSVGTQFINTAKWQFGRLIDGEYYEPLPGEWGISDPITIGAPDIVMTKTGPDTLGSTLNLGEWGTFTLDLQNTGTTEAWNTRITDRLPRGSTGGMCDATPEVLTAQVYSTDGITPVAGKGPLVEGVDYSFQYFEDPACRFVIQMQSPAATIGVGERLIIAYRTQLDADSRDGARLTNVAGASVWYNDDPSNRNVVVFRRSVTDGTINVLDHQDAHTVTVALYGYFFEKTVENLTTGAYPTTTASPGDTLRYSLRLQTTDGPLDDVQFIDDLGAYNGAARFVPGSLTLDAATIPPGADASNSDPLGGSNGDGLIDIRNIDVPASSEVLIQYDVTLAPTLVNGTIVTNQAGLFAGVKLVDSDDPFVNGQSSPDVTGDEDPTVVLIQADSPTALVKTTAQGTATIGETFTYQVTIPAAPHTAPLYDVRILDDLAAGGAELEFVSATLVAGPGGLNLQNTGTPTSIVIEDPVNGIDIPVGEQVVIDVAVRLQDTPANVAGVTFTNTASYTYNLADDNPLTELPGDPGTSGPVTIVEPDLTLEKSGPLQMRLGMPGTFTLNLHNVGDSPAWNVTIGDQLPNQVDGGTCDAPPQNISAQVFEADGTTVVSATLVEGTDFTATFAADPACLLTLDFVTPETVIGADQRLIVSYDATLDPGSQENVSLTNISGATSWFSLDQAGAEAAYARNYTRAITDGTVGVLDHEDAHTTLVFTPTLIFEKVATNVSTGESPATSASPGDTIRYSLRVENVLDTNIDDLNIVDELDSLNASPYFQPGTLNVVTLPAGADAGNTDANGGAAGTGLLDVRSLSLNGPGDSLTIEFEVDLAPVIPDATVVLNQSEATYLGVTIALSDDPNINGAADPDVAGDEDPTALPIVSAPYFDVDKVSADLTGDPALLLAGDTLRYTITVQNTGTDDATNVEIVDAVPASTTYVPGSTTLNGAPVADGAGGGSPLIDGILINAPQDPTPGAMNAGVPDNVATITFDVVVYPDAPDGTIISNQAFVSAVDQGVADIPSDDPRTDIPDDPTRDVVGAYPLLFAPKTAALQVDAGSPGIVDPGDVLRYTITVYNNGTVPATIAELYDAVPANTTYVPDSTTLNGEPAGQPDNGVFPLENRLPVSSADLTPPLPGQGEGVINPGESAVVQFDLQVNAGVAPGTLITNQATVYTDELPNLFTDGDGNPATGPEPTVVVVGDAQQLSIIKEVAVLDGGPALPGATLVYTVTVRNIGTVPATDVLITDDLDVPNPGYLQYVDQSATLNGLMNGVTINGSLITVDYSTAYGMLMPDQTIVLRFRAVIGPNLAIGTTVSNTAQVYWNDPQQTASATVNIDVGAMPNAAMISGEVWHDADHDGSPGGLERPLEGWTVELLLDGQPIRSVQSDADGYYEFVGVAPNYASGQLYSIRFSAPGAGPATALLGVTDSDFTDTLQRIDNIEVTEGSIWRSQNMPIDPNGVIYDSMARAPIAGASVSLVDARSGLALPGACFDDPNQQNQLTVANGYYKFDLNFSDPACPSGLNYVIEVTPPATGYISGVSDLIPPTSDTSTLPFDVPACPASASDAVAATAQHCEAAPSEFAPPGSVAAGSPGTVYHSFLTLDNSQSPGSSQLYNNHIPLDPRLDGAISVTKTTPMINVSRGDLVPYVITVSNAFGADLFDVNIVDRFPAGFRYVDGSARFDGVPAEPALVGQELTWSDLLLASDGRHEIKLLFAVGAGVTEGEFVNRAQALNGINGAVMSEEATATVRVVPDPTFDCTDVYGKVYDDANRNGSQDGDEAGLAGVRLVTVTGLAATTDADGQYHITCATVPSESRGSNFVLKLDDRTLPSGYRVSTRPVQIQRATRGKALRLNFGASIYRVVGLDISDPVFETDSVEMRSQWRSRVGLLISELRKAPAVLRLSYVADIEEEALVERRLESLKRQIIGEWQSLDAAYELVIESEIYWRLGGPPKRPRGTDR